jgi:hypothetical protein
MSKDTHIVCNFCGTEYHLQDANRKLRHAPMGFQSGLICRTCYDIDRSQASDSDFDDLERIMGSSHRSSVKYNDPVLLSIVDTLLDCCVSGSEVLNYLDSNGYKIVKK